jgi:hypothetical protein
MSTEIEDLGQRVEHLERIVASLESRLDMNEMYVQILSDRRSPRATRDAADHTSALRSVATQLELLAGRRSNNG